MSWEPCSWDGCKGIAMRDSRYCETHSSPILTRMEKNRRMAAQEQSKSETQRWERPLEVRIDPSSPMEALVVWKGVLLGALREVVLTIDGETSRVRIIRSASASREEAVWDEMREAGIEVEDDQ